MFPSDGSKGAGCKCLEQKCAIDHWRVLRRSIAIVQPWVSSRQSGGMECIGILLLNLNLPRTELAKKPKDLYKVDLANAVPFQEFGIDPGSMKCLELGEALRKYYFGYTSISKGTLWSYLTVCFAVWIYSMNGPLQFVFVFVFFSCWATNYSFIRCIVPSSIVPSAVMHQRICIDSVSARIPLAQRNFSSGRRCREHVTLMIFRTCSERWCPKCPSNRRKNGERLNGCANASLCSRVPGIQTTMWLHQLSGNQLRQ